MSEEFFHNIKRLDSAEQDGGLRTKNIFKSSLPSKPLITIITAVLNNEKYLEECILSLRKQKYNNYESTRLRQQNNRFMPGVVRVCQ